LRITFGKISSGWSSPTTIFGVRVYV
jgi:hypothetical protein